MEPTPKWKTKPFHLDLFPIRCYGCGKVLEQIAIERALKSGEPLKSVMDRLGYQRLCCRQDIMSAPLTLQLIKDQEMLKRPLDLTISQTGAFDVPQGPMKIVDEMLPGVDKERCLTTGLDEEFMNESNVVDAYTFHIQEYLDEAPEQEEL